MTRKPVSKPQPPANEDEEPMGETLAAVKAAIDAKKRWAPSAKQIGLGAAVGIGSAAIVAGLLYWRGNRK
ncbi:hypothetical protein [Sphingomonas sp.]|uniref:hypothetical protein n=1 Tax=Sphingomonas sp. TaxID=28214 RepID=UPI001B158C21|nr:hypothetical protein [Sphingomonas sp.]MBO9712784.1 hypothetical protein [Sphingomonas sp.]